MGANESGGLESRPLSPSLKTDGGHILTSVEKLVNSGRHFTLANVSRCSCGNGGSSRTVFPCEFLWRARWPRACRYPRIASACSRSDIARECTGINAHFPLIVCAPRVSQCGRGRERRGEEDGTRGPRERHRRRELAPCAQPSGVRARGSGGVAPPSVSRRSGPVSPPPPPPPLPPPPSPPPPLSSPLSLGFR
ncbi:hypothetical protein PUN28_019981 [Cardiocondyla obscurior]|uniref:Uncharacterized protein n=1 Tax=Cardiocondyla obscurior TaxID=286306 RepID=A0AAW2EC94_9HYME